VQLGAAWEIIQQHFEDPLSSQQPPPGSRFPFGEFGGAGGPIIVMFPGGIFRMGRRFNPNDIDDDEDDDSEEEYMQEEYMRCVTIPSCHRL
jgi:hypothetical protein